MVKLRPVEILSAAIITKTPYVIVEGVDDISIYEAIAHSVDIHSFVVYSSEMIEGFTGGNAGVTQALEAISKLVISKEKTPKDYILGIIDRDANFYRGKKHNNKLILQLKFYSIESHFISKKSIELAAKQLTRTSSIDKENIDLIYKNVEKRLFNLFYFSLEALKNSIFENYKSIIKFSDSIEKIKNEKIMNTLRKKERNLNSFATHFKLTSSIESLRDFVKGTWLLTVYAEELFFEIKQLESNCKNQKIKQCRMCSLLPNKKSCMYKIESGFNKNSLYSILKSFVNVPELDYIKDTFKRLEKTARK